MHFRKITAAATATTFAGLLFVATANAEGPGMGSTLGECYNNWVSYCNEETGGYPAGYPEGCYGESLDLCDNHHNPKSAIFSPSQIQTLRTDSLSRAKRTQSRNDAPPTKKAD
ncbi:hypothetical protein [Flexibacterium corallicola]|uniref:hypothetical protein n=1 Tax=Flexibacterium corallicola TaxID=3037259 RepID=UPI00286ED1DB|nr:hypothetical protein [Pseudovibrio sp. M1P-2-3]